MECNLTEEEVVVLKMLIAKGIKGDVKEVKSSLSDDVKIRSYDERVIWIKDCMNNKSIPK